MPLTRITGKRFNNFKFESVSACVFAGDSTRCSDFSNWQNLGIAESAFIYTPKRMRPELTKEKSSAKENFSSSVRILFSFLGHRRELCRKPFRMLFKEVPAPKSSRHFVNFAFAVGWRFDAFLQSRIALRVIRRGALAEINSDKCYLCF